MTPSSTDDQAERQREEAEDRYAQLTLDGEEYVIYDRENHTAWVQSSESVSLEDYR